MVKAGRIQLLLSSSVCRAVGGSLWIYCCSLIESNVRFSVHHMPMQQECTTRHFHGISLYIRNRKAFHCWSLYREAVTTMTVKITTRVLKPTRTFDYLVCIWFLCGCITLIGFNTLWPNKGMSNQGFGTHQRGHTENERGWEIINDD